MPEQLGKLVRALQDRLHADAICLWSGELDTIAVPVICLPRAWLELPFVLPRDQPDTLVVRDANQFQKVLPISLRASLQSQPLEAVVSVRHSLGAHQRVGLLAVWQSGNHPPEGLEALADLALKLLSHDIWRVASNDNLLDADPMMHALANTLAQGIVVVPLDGHHGFVNPPAARFLNMAAGVTSPEVLAQALQALVARTLNAAEVSRFATQALRAEGLPAHASTLVWRFASEPLALRVTISPVQTTHLRAWSWLLEDVSAEISMQDELAGSERKFRQFYQTLRDAVVFYDLQGQPTECNGALQALLGTDLVDIRQLQPQSLGWQASEWAEVRSECLSLGYSHPRERQLTTQAGTSMHVEAVAHLRRNALDEPDGIWEVLHDVTQRKQAEAQLILSAEAFARHSDGVLLSDKDWLILTANDAFVRDSGYSREELRGKGPEMLRSGHQDAEFYQRMRREIELSGWWQGGIWNRSKSGELYYKWLTINAVRDADNHLTHYIGVYRDAAVVKEAQSHIEFLATHDSLTLLPNQLSFEDRLQVAVAQEATESPLLGVLMFHLDGLPAVNSVRGQSAGDQLIKEVARRLQEFSSDGKTVARLSGNRFGLMLRAVDASSLLERCNYLLQTLNQPHEQMGERMVAPVSLGVSLFPTDGTDVQTLLLKASAALNMAREQGEHGCQFYAEEMDRRVRQRFEMENGLRQGLEQGQLFLQYQPQVATRDGSIEACEALLRWRRPEGVVSPAEFIPVAEMSGLIIPITEWVLRQVCRDIRTWDARGTHIAAVSVNLSARHFALQHMESSLLRIVQEEGVSPARICLEITEGVLMDPQRSEQKMDTLKQAGFAISVDDFGTGYSSLSYLKRFPLDELKIDRSFVAGIERDEGDRAIITAVLSLAHSLRLRVVAEGVELPEQASYLKALGCALIQGYLYSRPLDAPAFESFARRHMQLSQ